MAIEGEWSVQFDQKGRGPKNPIAFTTLQDWSKSENDSVKYFSGHAIYAKSFNFDQAKQGETIMLDLGNLTAIAKVKLNGIAVGGAWIAPFRIDITSVLKAGENKLEISVVNTWVNRLIGDSKLPEAQRKTSLTVNPYKPDSKLQPSGLLGPVKIEVMN
ncbi:glycosylhydrolase-like jelly roll fold domain-containing protein [Pedobacter frigidisoli]|uniref:glycosylhydrolase-like jelly roll fold domain-containing protein n=1 Tax=Pedobacter frigidisoli TaxID=2530455 RepID=UPI001CEC5CEA|nr:glycosylhydrolase-like jelly roll fold domain-containing protein [Pedobacter frigidisoli]